MKFNKEAHWSKRCNNEAYYTVISVLAGLFFKFVHLLPTNFVLQVWISSSFLASLILQVGGYNNT